MTVTQIEKDYRFRVATAGSTSISGNEDFTETSNIAEVGPVGGQRVDAKASRTAARPWSVDIVDASEAITEDLADSNGRADLLRRLCDISVSTDGGSTWTVLATGRIGKVEMVDVAAFRFTVQDERLIERQTTLFQKTNTTRLAPAGLDVAWLDFAGGQTAKVEVDSVNAPANTTTYKVLHGRGPMYVSELALNLMDDDLVDGLAQNAANWNDLKVNIDGTDRDPSTLDGAQWFEPLKRLEDQEPNEFGLRAISSFTVAGYQDTAGNVYEAYFHMKGRDPSADLPLHIGGQAGIDPFTLVKNIYDGTYQDASNPSTVRYDSNTFAAYDEASNPDGLIDNPRFPKMHFRITRPQNMARWLEDNIFGPLGVTPFVNEDGEVDPRITRWAATDQVSDIDNLFEFNKSNSSPPHPSWRNEGSEQVTVVEVEYTYATTTQFAGEGRSGERKDSEPFSESLDLYVENTTVETREHDIVSSAGRVVHRVPVTGIHRSRERKEFADLIAQEIFNRFGDGPIYTDVKGLSGSESVRPGDWVVLDLDSYPSLQNQSRSGKRIAQVLTRMDTPAGPNFELIEGGEPSQPLSTPSISAAQNTGNAKHAIDITISGLGTGESYEVHIAENASEPAEKSPEWQYRHRAGTGNETFTQGYLPSGSTFWARARATKPGRFSSDWATATSATTNSLSAPTGLSASGIAGDEATLSWTNGESDYDTVVELDSSFLVRIRDGSTEYELTELDLSTSYTAGVKHADNYGGESNTATTSFTTTATASTLADMDGIRVLVGGAP